MSRRSNGNFQTYHGRRSSRAVSFLKWIIVFLLAVLVVAVGVYFLLQECLVYDGDGVRVVLPWDQEEQTPSPDPIPSDTASPVPSEPVVVISDDPEPPPAPSLTLRDEALQMLHAVAVDQDGILAGLAEQQVQDAGGNAVLVEMKREDGALNYVSGVELAVSLGASSSDGAADRAIRALTQGELYTIAQVSCFRDHLMGTQDVYALHTNSGWRWKDLEGVRWTCAANGTVQDYLIDICVELAQMGFDEILLTNCGYPISDREHIGWIRRGSAYPSGELDTIVSPFLARVAEALEPYDVRLSVMADAAELAGERALTGLTLEGGLASCDRLWVDGEDLIAHDSFADAPEQPGEKLIPVSSTPGGEDAPWAVSPAA